ncbi:MFS transporter [Metabacillus herbersteinensis]|uniref:MFS transporter n=1 Tax=Metabacillus herbersteinensis TaxID=283816 RepID=UPI00366F526F
MISVVYKETESASVTAFIPFTITSAMFISSLLTPIVIGKWNLKMLLFGSQVGKTILLFVLAINLMSTASYLWLFPIIATIAFLDGCANPFRQTLIPHYVEKEHLLRANGIAETVTQTIQLLMWFIASLLLLVLTATQLIWIVFVVFMIASILLSLLTSVEQKRKNQPKISQQLSIGWKTIASLPLLTAIARINFLEYIAEAVWVSTIIYVFVDQALNKGEAWWGFINGSFFGGVILGSLICIRYSSYLEKNLSKVMLISSLMSCISTFLFGLTTLPVIALALSAFIGITGQLESIPKQTVIQKSVSKDELATVYTSLNTIGTGTFGFAALIMGVISDLFGIRSVFILASLILLLVTVIIYKKQHLFTIIGNSEVGN